MSLWGVLWDAVLTNWVLTCGFARSATPPAHRDGGLALDRDRTFHPRDPQHDVVSGLFSVSESEREAARVRRVGRCWVGAGVTFTRIPRAA